MPNSFFALPVITLFLILLMENRRVALASIKIDQRDLGRKP
jgi:hypothetical protein